MRVKVFLVLSMCLILLSCDKDYSAQQKDDLSTISDAASNPDTILSDDFTLTDEDALSVKDSEEMADIDSYIDPQGDADGDGILNGIECPETPCKDSDSDGIPDYLDNDSDNDGLSDHEEILSGCFNPNLEDTDNDGTDDFSEYIYGYDYQPGTTDPCDPKRNVPDGIIFEMLPSARQITHRITITIPYGTADVIFLLDGSGSMKTAMPGILAEIKDKMVVPLAAELPEIAFGAARFGWETPFTQLSPVTQDTEAFLSTIESLPAEDSYVQQSIGFFLSASGAALYETAHVCMPSKFGGCDQTIIPDSNIFFDPVSCVGTEGTIGGMCFRSMAKPIFVMVTDDAFTGCGRHDQTPPGNTESCYYQKGNGIRIAEAIAAISARGAKFIGIDAGFEETDGSAPAYSPTSKAATDFTAVAQATGSLGTLGAPFIFHTETPEGTGLSSEVADAIRSLAAPITADITIAAGEGGDSCDGKAFSGVLKNVKTVLSEPSDGVSGFDEKTFFNAAPGTRLTFEISLYNDFCKNTPIGFSYFHFPLDILANGKIIGVYQAVIGIKSLE